MQVVGESRRRNSNTLSRSYVFFPFFAAVQVPCLNQARVVDKGFWPLHYVAI